MNITIIGSGNLGHALANAFRKSGHRVIYGVRNPTGDFKGKQRVADLHFEWFGIEESVSMSEVVVLCASANAAVEVARQLGDVSKKILIDAMNLVFEKIDGFTNTSDAILSNCNGKDLVKCFNTTGFENITHPVYDGISLDMFVAGDSKKAKDCAVQLAKDIGFKEVYDFGGNNRFFLLEQWALCWINLAAIQQKNRNLAFKILKRHPAYTP